MRLLRDAAATLLLLGWPLVAAVPAQAQVRFVTVLGCAGPGADETSWSLTHATADETSTNPNAVIQPRPGTTEELAAAADAPLGTLTYRLIGVSQYALADYGAHKVLVKGLLIDPEGERRLNVTSIQSAAPTCATP